MSHSKQSKETDQQRRAFLRGAALTGAAMPVVASLPAIAQAESPDVTQEADTSDRRENKGYALTQHISDYYKSASA